MDQILKRIESKEEVEQYLNKLKYALCNNAKMLFQEIRSIDKNRNIRYTNKYTISELFPNENPINVLERELISLHSNVNSIDINLKVDFN